MKKEDLNALASLYETVYSPAESGEYLSEEYLEEYTRQADRPGQTPAEARAAQRAAKARGASVARAYQSKANTYKAPGIGGALSQLGRFLSGPSPQGRMDSELGRTRTPKTTPKPAPTPPAGAVGGPKFSSPADEARQKARAAGNNPDRPAAKPAPKPAPSPAPRPAPSPAPKPAPRPSAPSPARQTGNKAKDMAAWAKANPKLAAAKAQRDATRGTSATTNPLMRGMKSRLPATSTSSSTPSLTGNKSSNKKTTIMNNTEWPSAKTIKDLATAYSSVYEAKKVDQDQDGDNDFDDVRIARMIASGMSKEEAMRKVKEDPKGDEVKEEVEEIDEAAKRIPKKKRGAKDPVEYMKGRSDAGKRISGDEKSGPVSYSVRGAKKDAPTQPGEKPKNTPKLSKREKEYAKYAHASTMGGIKKGYLRFGGSKGLPEDTNYLNNIDTDNNTGSISEMTQEELIYNIVASHLLENGFAEDIDDANAMMESMSSAWVGTIIEEYNEYVEDYNEFVEDLEIAGYDLSEATEEDIEEAYKDVDTKERVKKAANKEKAEKNIKKFSKYRAKGIEQSNRMRGALTGGRKADRPAVKGDKSKDAPGGYDPEKLNKDWYSRATPGSKMRRKGGEMETVSQRMDREHPYKNRMTGKMGREYGSRAAANVTDVLRALEGNRKKMS